MNTEKINQEVLNDNIVDDVDSEDYQDVLNTEQEVFEDGIDIDDIPELEMEEDDINEQTEMFLKLRGKK